MNSTSLENSSEPCLWFLLRSKSSMQRSIPTIMIVHDRIVHIIVSHRGTHTMHISPARFACEKAKRVSAISASSFEA